MIKNSGSDEGPTTSVMSSGSSGPSASALTGASARSGSAGAAQRTSLLQYVVKTALASFPAVADLPEQLSGLKAAANVQVSAIGGLVREIQAGYARLREEAECVRELLAEAEAEEQHMQSCLAGEATSEGLEGVEESNKEEEDDEKTIVMRELIAADKSYLQQMDAFLQDYEEDIEALPELEKEVRKDARLVPLCDEITFANECTYQGLSRHYN